MYPQKEPATLVRFVGHAPLEATVFAMERLRGNACGEVFTADEPETAGSAKYNERAVAMIALLKYGTRVPFKRLERLQGQLGMPLPAATQCELMGAAAELRRALAELIRQAAQGRCTTTIPACAFCDCRWCGVAGDLDVRSWSGGGKDWDSELLFMEALRC